MGEYFSRTGKEFSRKTLEIAKEEAKKRGINQIVLASTTGETALLAKEIFKDTGIKIVVVTHSTGFREPGAQEFKEDVKKELESSNNIKVFTGTMIFRGIGRAIKNGIGFSPDEVVSATLRMFGQGTKVCCEIVVMAADAGLINMGEDVIAIAGTAKGADTALVIKPVHSHNFFDMKVKEVLAKPKQF